MGLEPQFCVQIPKWQCSSGRSWQGVVLDVEGYDSYGDGRLAAWSVDYLAIIKLQCLKIASPDSELLNRHSMLIFISSGVTFIGFTEIAWLKEVLIEDQVWCDVLACIPIRQSQEFLENIENPSFQS